MRKIIVSEFVSLDGVMEDPGGAEGTPHGGWSFIHFSKDCMLYKLEELTSVEALLLGRITYQGFATAWPSRKDDDGFAGKMNTMPKYVVSSTLHEASWQNSTILRGNVFREIAKLRESPGGDILVAGSQRLVMGLLDHDLADELRLMVHPLVLGKGRRLFERGAVFPSAEKREFRLSAALPYDTGVVVLVYQSVRT